MSYAADITALNFGSNELYGGLSGNYAGLDMDNSQGSLDNFYTGIANNYDADPVNESSISVSKDQEYFGISTNFNTETNIDNMESQQMDNQPILLHPKDQLIYYKLYGFNTNTQTYETWIISENIVTRPELFNPPGSPPNTDLGVYVTPPSGNPLVNVKIIGRWIQ